MQRVLYFLIGCLILSQNVGAATYSDCNGIQTGADRKTCFELVKANPNLSSMTLFTCGQFYFSSVQGACLDNLKKNDRLSVGGLRACGLFSGEQEQKDCIDAVAAHPRLSFQLIYACTPFVSDLQTTCLKAASTAKVAAEDINSCVLVYPKSAQKACLDTLGDTSTAPSSERRDSGLPSLRL